MTQVHYDAQIINQASITTGTTSAYVLARPMTVLADALRVYFEPHVNNVAGPVTIDVEGTGAIEIVYDDGTALLANDLKAGAKYGIVYSTTLGKYVLQRSKSNISGDPETFITRWANSSAGSGTSDDQTKWLVQYGSDIALITGNGQVYQKAISWPDISNQMIARATLALGVYGGTMIYQWYAYILDNNDGNNVRRVDLTTDLEDVGNWWTVTVGHTRTYTDQFLLGINAGKVYILDYSTSGAIVKRFDFGGATWTYEADQFICNDIIGDPITGANAEGIANSQGLTISWEAINLNLVRYDYAGNVLSSFGDGSVIVAPGHFRALPNRQYSSWENNSSGAIQIYRKFDF